MKEGPSKNLPFCRLPSVGRPRLSAYWARRGGADGGGGGDGGAAGEVVLLSRLRHSRTPRQTLKQEMGPLRTHVLA